MNAPVNNYIHSEKMHNTAAAEAFLPVLLKHIKPQSVVDIGCGLGTWLAIFKKNGITDILGVDGNDINIKKLHIDAQSFLLHDLTRPLQLKRKYDLAICLEVVEHLPESAADTIVNTLTNSSDCILFSSALPNQGGQNHLNEQSFDYWMQKFNKQGFIMKDLFRATIWENEQIDWWYRQNMFLVQRSDEPQKPLLDFYHPYRYRQIAKELEITSAKLLHYQSGSISTIQALKMLIKTLFKVGK